MNYEVKITVSYNSLFHTIQFFPKSFLTHPINKSVGTERHQDELKITGERACDFLANAAHLLYQFTQLNAFFKLLALAKLYLSDLFKMLNAFDNRVNSCFFNLQC